MPRRRGRPTTPSGTRDGEAMATKTWGAVDVDAAKALKSLGRKLTAKK
jgi:hypothetical protein